MMESSGCVACAHAHMHARLPHVHTHAGSRLTRTARAARPPLCVSLCRAATGTAPTAAHAQYQEFLTTLKTQTAQDDDDDDEEGGEGEGAGAPPAEPQLVEEEGYPADSLQGGGEGPGAVEIAGRRGKGAVAEGRTRPEGCVCVRGRARVCA